MSYESPLAALWTPPRRERLECFQKPSSKWTHMGYAWRLWREDAFRVGTRCAEVLDKP